MLDIISIFLLALLLIQVMVETRVSGILIGTFFLLFIFYCLMGLTSQVNKAPVFNDEVKRFLLIGSIWLGLSFIAVAAIIIKYSLQQPRFPTRMVST